MKKNFTLSQEAVLAYLVTAVVKNFSWMCVCVCVCVLHILLAVFNFFQLSLNFVENIDFMFPVLK